MSGETGLRERKKQRTYRTISETAIAQIGRAHV